MKYCFTIILIIASVGAYSQDDGKASFTQLLDSAQVYFAQPLESFYRPRKVIDNEIIDYQFAWRSKQDPLEVWYHVQPIPAEDQRSMAPQILISSMAMSMASNEEGDTDMVFHRLPDEEIAKYNADLGVVIFFKPKSSLSTRRHCKAIFYYAIDKGIIGTFLLFDKTDIDLDIYDDALNFTDN